LAESVDFSLEAKTFAPEESPFDNTLTQQLEKSDKNDALPSPTEEAASQVIPSSPRRSTRKVDKIDENEDKLKNSSPSSPRRSARKCEAKEIKTQDDCTKEKLLSSPLKTKPIIPSLLSVKKMKECVPSPLRSSFKVDDIESEPESPIAGTKSRNNSMKNVKTPKFNVEVMKIPEKEDVKLTSESKVEEVNANKVDLEKSNKRKRMSMDENALSTPIVETKKFRLPDGTAYRGGQFVITKHQPHPEPTTFFGRFAQRFTKSFFGMS
jgi:hypothetical protein